MARNPRDLENDPVYIQYLQGAILWRRVYQHRGVPNTYLKRLVRANLIDAYGRPTSEGMKLAKQHNDAFYAMQPPTLSEETKAKQAATRKANKAI